MNIYKAAIRLNDGSKGLCEVEAEGDHSDAVEVACRAFPTASVVLVQAHPVGTEGAAA